MLLVLLPLWLVASGGGALWYYFHREKKQALVEQERFAQNVSTPLLADDLRKIVEVIGERNASSETAAANLSRTASMIEGLLGPSNTGYAVRQTKGPADWPLLQVTLTGKNPDAPAVWVLTSYDSRAGSRGAEANATGLAATLAAAQALARDKPEVSIHFVFLPHANDPESPVIETAAKFLELAKSAGTAQGHPLRGGHGRRRTAVAEFPGHDRRAARSRLRPRRGLRCGSRLPRRRYGSRQHAF